MKRTDYCGRIDRTRLGQIVTVCGWVHRRRDHGGVIFIDLRDREGLLQIVCDPDRDVTFAAAEKLRNEFVIAVTGLVRPRREGTINTNMITGEIEVLAHEIEILNASLTPPFLIDDENISETVRLEHRVLDLRRASMQKNLVLRHKASMSARRYLDAHGFVDIETPVLYKSTPEGAREFLVPSRIHPGQFYALPQSPQLFKQLLMMAGFDRYYQIAKCFRDEDLRADRQMEFTQIDIEASFIQPADIYRLIEGMMARVLALKGIEVPMPFPRLTWAEAMRRFGSDKPDLRFGLELAEVTDLVRTAELRVFRDAAERGGLVKALAIPDGGRLSRKDLDTLPEAVATFGAKGVAWARLTSEGWQSPIAKFLSPEQRSAIERASGAEPGGVILFLADSAKVVNDSLSHLRLKLAAQLGLIPPDAHAFLWVTEFPLFEHSPEENRAVSVNHPFTAPLDADVERLESDPYGVRAQAYDVVWNGLELGGGSIRIHRPDVQARVFTQLGMTAAEGRARFGFLLDALAYGAPPHGGIALGLDRMAMLLCGASSLRDVIAFPKTQRATCLMTEAPSPVDSRQLRELGIRVVE